MTGRVTDMEMEWFRKATEAALRRAAVQARERARVRKTRIVVLRDGQVVLLDPDLNSLTAEQRQDP